MKYTHLILLLALLTMASCASNDVNNSDTIQGPPGMSGGKGMGRGGGGGHNGPPMKESEYTQAERPLPEEAFTACTNKKEGEAVLLHLPEGEEIKATCTIVDDHMVAVPAERKTQSHGGRGK